jgi:hypothetical protein
MAGRLLVLLSLLAAVPLAVVVAGIVRSRLEASAAAQAAASQETSAVVLEDTSLEDTALDPPYAGGESAGFSVVRAEVNWHGPRGVVRNGTLMVQAGTVAGTRVPVWIDRSGYLTNAPLDPATISDDAVLMGLAVAAGVPGTVWGLHCGLCAGLDAHRARRCGQDWARVEREWRARRS